MCNQNERQRKERKKMLDFTDGGATVASRA
jgi:hypothetical protein